MRPFSSNRRGRPKTVLSCVRQSGCEVDQARQPLAKRERNSDTDMTCAVEAASMTSVAW